MPTCTFYTILVLPVTGTRRHPQRGVVRLTAMPISSSCVGFASFPGRMPGNEARVWSGCTATPTFSSCIVYQEQRGVVRPHCHTHLQLMVVYQEQRDVVRLHCHTHLQLMHSVSRTEGCGEATCTCMLQVIRNWTL